MTKEWVEIEDLQIYVFVLPTGCLVRYFRGTELLFILGAVLNDFIEQEGEEEVVIDDD